MLCEKWTKVTSKDYINFCVLCLQRKTTNCKTKGNNCWLIQGGQYTCQALHETWYKYTHLLKETEVNKYCVTRYTKRGDFPRDDYSKKQEHIRVIPINYTTVQQVIQIFDWLRHVTHQVSIARMINSWIKSFLPLKLLTSHKRGYHILL